MVKVFKMKLHLSCVLIAHNNFDISRNFKKENIMPLRHARDILDMNIITPWSGIFSLFHFRFQDHFSVLFYLLCHFWCSINAFSNGLYFRIEEVRDWQLYCLLLLGCHPHSLFPYLFLWLLELVNVANLWKPSFNCL